MSIIEIFILAIGLSMDALAVSICKGLSISGKPQFKQCLICGIWFGLFQAIMPLIGYFLGTKFAQHIQMIDHWIAFFLLLFIGGKMLKEGIDNKTEEVDDSFSIKDMFILALATSIDALAVGISFAVLPDVNIYTAISIIGIITFIISFAGVKIGNVFGLKYKNKAEIVGGVILIAIGLKILLEHLIYKR